MSILTDIKKRISELEGGAFQELCDSLLSRSGYKGIHAYGMQAGSMKTTMGNPDTYFKDQSGKYIFVAYTTQKSNLFNKAKEDILKCLDVSKTGVKTKDISEIIFCHTSSNLSAGDDMSLTDICKREGVLLQIYGIDRIADEIYRNHKILSKDHLGLSIDTNQIMDIETFIEKYDTNEMATPLSTIFQFRESDFAKIKFCLNTERVVAVIGQAGVGKTRLSLEVAKVYGLENGYRVFCIRSIELPIAEDITSFIERPGKYLLLIDDANELNGLKSILEYLNYYNSGYDIKIIATMREYTAKKVINQIKEYTKPYVIEIDRLTDDEIKSFLDVNLGIRNPVYVDKIIKIAEGNARIAYMAGKLANSKQNLDAIQDATDLYEDYYGIVLSNSQILADRNLIMSAGILALLHTINLEDLTYLESLFQKIDLSNDEFKSHIYSLFEMEFVDIKLDKVAMITDQCLENYILFYCFFKKKYANFADILEVGFRNFRNGIINSLSMLLNIFRSDKVHNYLETEIKKVWEIFEKESEEIFYDFVKVFHTLRPLESLIYVKEKIEKIDEKVFDLRTIDITKNDYRDNDKILELLVGYRYLENFETAIELICDYAKKNKYAIINAFSYIKNYYSVNQYSSRNDYLYEKRLINTLKRKNDCEVLNKLFLMVSNHFLQTKFNSVENSRGKNFVMYNIPLILTDGCKELRKLIWQELLIISDSGHWDMDIYKILDKYSKELYDVNKDIALYDQDFIIRIILKLDNCSDIKRCNLVINLEEMWKKFGLSIDERLKEIYLSDICSVYKMFNSRPWGGELSYSDAEELRITEITRFANDININKFDNLVKLLNAIIFEIDEKKYEFLSSIEIFIEVILTDQIKLKSFVESLISYGFNIDIQPRTIITNLISGSGVEETYNYLLNKKFPLINKWQFIFFEFLPKEDIDDIWVERLLKFIKDDSDKIIHISSCRNLLFLEKYLDVDDKIFIKCSRLILKKKEYSLYMVKIYFSLLFNISCYSPDKLYKYFEGEESLLKHIYFCVAETDYHIDYNGSFIKYFISQDISWLHSYAEYFEKRIDENKSNEQERITSCWTLENYIEVFDYLFIYLADSKKIDKWKVGNGFADILSHKDGENEILVRQKLWIIHSINENFNNEKIYLLFDIISELGVELRIEAIKIFVSLNKNFETFSKLSLEPKHCGGSGSIVPYMQARSEYYQSLLPIFTGLEFLQHKKFIKDKIEMSRNRAEKEEIDEMLKARFF